MVNRPIAAHREATAGTVQDCKLRDCCCDERVGYTNLIAPHGAGAKLKRSSTLQELQAVAELTESSVLSAHGCGCARWKSRTLHRLIPPKSELDSPVNPGIRLGRGRVSPRSMQMREQ